MYYKGIILDVKENYCLVMDEKGIVYRIKKKDGSEEGQKIYFLEEDFYKEEKKNESGVILPFTGKENPKRIKRSTLQRITAIAAAILICLGTIGLPQFAKEAYATVSVDGTESIQIELNRNGKIVSVSSYGNTLSEEEMKLYQGKSIEEFWKIFSVRNKENQEIVLIGYAALKGGPETEQKIKTELLRSTKGTKTVYLKGIKADVENAKKASQSLGSYMFGQFEDRDDFEDFLEDSSRENVIQFIEQNRDMISPEKAQQILTQKDRIDAEEAAEDKEESQETDIDDEEDNEEDEEDE